MSQNSSDQMAKSLSEIHRSERSFGSFLLYQLVITRERFPDDEFEVVGAGCEEGAGPVPLDAIHATLIQDNGNYIACICNPINPR